MFPGQAQYSENEHGPTIFWFAGLFLLVIPAAVRLAQRVFPNDPMVPGLDQSYNRCLALKRRGEGDAGNRSITALMGAARAEYERREPSSPASSFRTRGRSKSRGHDTPRHRVAE